MSRQPDGSAGGMAVAPGPSAGPGPTDDADDSRAVRVAMTATTALEGDPILVVAPASAPARAGGGPDPSAGGPDPEASDGIIVDGRRLAARLRRLDETRAILEVVGQEPGAGDDPGSDPGSIAAGEGPGGEVPAGEGPAGEGPAAGERLGPGRTRVLIGTARRAAGGRATVREVVVDGWRFEVSVEPERQARLRERARRGDAAGSAGGPVEVRAIIPGRVVAVSVEPGDTVVAGQQILVVEAMKMQNELRAPREGIVERVGVAVGATIDVGDLLVVIH